jgi:hypothetical protein
VSADVGHVGTDLIVLLCGGRFGVDTLSRLRYTTYMKLCSTSRSAIVPETLPPTERAAFFHALRSHMQIVDWQRLSTGVLAAEDWGWKLSAGKLVPVKTDQAPAPDDLLTVIRCGCKMSSRNTCGSSMCSCRRNGLKCVSACSDCHGNDCCNTDQYMDVDDSEDENIGCYTVCLEEDLPWVVDEEIVDASGTQEPRSDDMLEEKPTFEECEDDDIPWYCEETIEFV